MDDSRDASESLAGALGRTTRLDDPLDSLYVARPT